MVAECHHSNYQNAKHNFFTAKMILLLVNDSFGPLVCSKLQPKKDKNSNIKYAVDPE